MGYGGVDCVVGCDGVGGVVKYDEDSDKSSVVSSSREKRPAIFMNLALLV